MPGTKRPHQVGVLLSPIRLWDGAGVVDRTALRIGPCAQILIRCFFMAALEFHEMPVSCELVGHLGGAICASSTAFISEPPSWRICVSRCRVNSLYASKRE